MTDQTAEVDWQGAATPVSRRFDDLYYSCTDGLAETRHVFLAANDLPARFTPGFHIAELGFGAGLNMLAGWRCWLDAGISGPLRYTSVEAFPMRARDMHKALAAFPELHDLARLLLPVWAADARAFELPKLHARIIIGDARATLGRWSGTADAWFLDGFAPAMNPEMWEPELMAQVAIHTAPGGTFATYTAAGQVRRALERVGFSISRIPGHGRKRHMTRGRMGEGA
ncbi:tRNA (5-methylaminomethyl-2-thiouridine)(34)-methyltransferase MnmD [Rhodobacteraceae bacterium R_SAG10]|nr:tRNA (5-methylaminomethyl-2-thiouridine)(34)-methyltransferase MnmD [Rhodobacteraceae bacterium R_SAG10]